MWMSSEDEFARMKRERAQERQQRRQYLRNDWDGETLAKSSLSIEVSLRGLEVGQEEEEGGDDGRKGGSSGLICPIFSRAKRGWRGEKGKK